MIVRLRLDLLRRWEARTARGVRWYEDDPWHEATAAAARVRRARGRLWVLRGAPATWSSRSEVRCAAERLRARLQALEFARARLLEFDHGLAVETQAVLECAKLAERAAHDALANP